MKESSTYYRLLFIALLSIQINQTECLFCVMYSFHKSFYNLRLTCMFSLIFRNLTSIIIEWPRLRYLYGNQLYHNVHWLYMWEIIGKVRTNTK